MDDDVEALLKRLSDLADRRDPCSEDGPAYPVIEVSMRR